MDQRLYHNASYLCSAHELSQLPADTGAEVVFAGRSNAGKSSVINALTQQKKLARTSKQPGCTRQINFFQLGRNARLVDLPGYGYARVPDSLKAHWGRLIDGYLAQRRSIAGLVLIVDIRRSIAEPDTQMLAWCEARGLPARMLLNKADKLSGGAARRTCLEVEKRLGPGSVAQLFSAAEKSGLEELVRALEAWLAPAGPTPDFQGAGVQGQF